MLLLASALLMATGLASAALMPTYMSFAIALVLVGWSSQTFMTTANSIVQLWTEPAMRGRVMAIYMGIVQGCTPLGVVRSHAVRPSSSTWTCDPPR